MLKFFQKQTCITLHKYFSLNKNYIFTFFKVVFNKICLKSNKILKMLYTSTYIYTLLQYFFSFLNKK